MRFSERIRSSSYALSSKYLEFLHAEFKSERKRRSKSKATFGEIQAALALHGMQTRRRAKLNSSVAHEPVWNRRRPSVKTAAQPAAPKVSEHPAAPKVSGAAADDGCAQPDAGAHDADAEVRSMEVRSVSGQITQVADADADPQDAHDADADPQDAHDADADPQDAHDADADPQDAHDADAEVAQIADADANSNFICFAEQLEPPSKEVPFATLINAITQDECLSYVDACGTHGAVASAHSFDVVQPLNDGGQCAFKESFDPAGFMPPAEPCLALQKALDDAPVALAIEEIWGDRLV